MSKHTAGPWRWELNEKSRQVHLCGGVPQFDLLVMDFVRWGMDGAAPRLREPERDGLNIMHRCERWAQIVPGREHHAIWFKGLDHADARLIAAAPDLLAACQDALAALEVAGDAICTDPGHDPGVMASVELSRRRLGAAIAKAEGKP